MTIYLDQLLLTSFICNYLLFRSTLLLTHSPCQNLRLLLCSLLAGISTFILFTPFRYFLTSFLGKVLLSVFFVCLLTPYQNIKRFLANFIVLFLLSFLLGGMILFLNTFTSPLPSAKFTVIHTKPPWQNFLLALLLLTLFVLYYRHHLFLRPPTPAYVTLNYHDRSVTLSAIIDSGNLLIDPATDTPVIITNHKWLFQLLPQDLFDALCCDTYSSEQILLQFPQYHLRLIPYQTIDRHALLLALPLTSVQIITVEHTVYHHNHPILAFSPHPTEQDRQVIIPDKLIK